jgi:hypothetical protein
LDLVIIFSRVVIFAHPDELEHCVSLRIQPYQASTHQRLSGTFLAADSGQGVKNIAGLVFYPGLAAL